jgi:hypothetical protein
MFRRYSSIIRKDVRLILFKIITDHTFSFTARYIAVKYMNTYMTIYVSLKM